MIAEGVDVIGYREINAVLWEAVALTLAAKAGIPLTLSTASMTAM